MAPFDWSAILGFYEYGIYLVIGFCFGWVLESSGFGDSRKLAGQFYFRDMRVIKVMFTAIVTAAVLVAFAGYCGWLDPLRVWVNPTYMWSAIAGGFIMGLGFIVGGFCPGTSVVAAATLKIDGALFLLGVVVGVGLFGETVASFEDFWNAGSMGRFTIADAFGWDETQVVFGLVLLAFAVFLLVEFVESLMASRKFSWSLWSPRLVGPSSMAGAIALLIAAIFMMVRGPIDHEQKWLRVSEAKKKLLEELEIYIQPVELRASMDNNMLNLHIYDLRSEAQFNIFHVRDAQRVDLKDFSNRSVLKEMRGEPSNTIRVLMAGEIGVRVPAHGTIAEQAWKVLTSEGIGNVYILDGGIGSWLQEFGNGKVGFSEALGSRSELAYPKLPHGLPDFSAKIKVETKKALKGGCG